jgi:hypothetical protein
MRAEVIIKGRWTYAAAGLLLHRHEHVRIVWVELEEQGILPGTVQERVIKFDWQFDTQQLT